jgi:hypothetical protein
MSKHIHKYERVKWGRKGTIVFRCVISDCTHYLHPEFMKGRQAVCWGCGKTIVLRQGDLLRKRIKCSDCRRDSIPAQPLDFKQPEEPKKFDIELNIDELLENL